MEKQWRRRDHNRNVGKQWRSENQEVGEQWRSEEKLENRRWGSSVGEVKTGKLGSSGEEITMDITGRAVRADRLGGEQ